MQTRYSYDSIVYDSLALAESALYSDPNLYGSSQYEYKDTFFHGTFRRYQFLKSTTSAFTEGPKLIFRNALCNACPIFDAWGNNLCSTYPNSLKQNVCSSYAAWKSASAAAFDGTPYTLEFTGETDWVYQGTTQAHLQLPEETVFTSSVYTKSVTATLTGLGTSGNLDSNALSYASGHCAPGYRNYQNSLCQNTVTRNISVSGASLAEPNENNCTVGNPCSPTTGDKTASEADYSSGSLSFSRYYHSYQIYLDYAAMGKGWSHTYTGRVITEQGFMKVINGKGNAERYKCVDSPACLDYRSTSIAGQILRPVTAGWELYASSGEVRYFNTEGWLTRIINSAGSYREVNISHTADGKVSTVVDHQGRTLQFIYNTDGLVASVTLPSGDVISYQYTMPANSPMNANRFNLTKVVREDLTERVYHYEDQDDLGAPRFVHALTGITDENGVRFATYIYDDKGRVISSERAAGAGRVELNYTKRPGESFDWSITEVTSPLGEVVTYDMEPGPFRKPTDITDTRGNLSMSYDSETSWRTSRTDREGNQDT
ncbi:MAG: DUF6531 domain-containing protein, partial [Xanthomonadales bacterium]|nr:DUF6531 domain-containing protein [Xanthomonadales bacterium]